jgi:hypothetical protein
LFAVALSGASPALAQKPAAAPAQGTPYKPVSIVPPAVLNDPAFTSLRGQLGEAARKRDAAAVTRLVIGTGFFWERNKTDAAGKRRTGFEILSSALGLASKDSVGWDMLVGYADDPSASQPPSRKGAFCAPADPAYDVAAFDKMLKATQTGVADWGYAVSNGIDVRATASAAAPVIEKLGLHFVRLMPEAKASSAAFLRIVAPSGKIGYVSIDVIAPFGNDQICYVKDAGGWKIGGYIGGGEAQ